MPPEASRLERALDRLGSWLATWRGWALLGVVVGAGVVAASGAVSPVDGAEQLRLGVFPFGGECAFRAANGHPCPNCGMTRSWVYAARGRFDLAFAYNGAGAALWVAAVWGGVVGAARLATGRSDLLRWRPAGLVGVAVGWTAVWSGIFVARWVGWLALP
jgi:hypothetical protein